MCAPSAFHLISWEPFLLLCIHAHCTSHGILDDSDLTHLFEQTCLWLCQIIFYGDQFGYQIASLNSLFGHHVTSCLGTKLFGQQVNSCLCPPAPCQILPRPPSPPRSHSSSPAAAHAGRPSPPTCGRPVWPSVAWPATTPSPSPASRTT